MYCNLTFLSYFYLSKWKLETDLFQHFRVNMTEFSNMYWQFQSKIKDFF